MHKVLILVNNVTMKSICCRNGLLYHYHLWFLILISCTTSGIFCNNQAIEVRNKVVSTSSDSEVHETYLMTQSCVVIIVKPVKGYFLISVLRETSDQPNSNRRGQTGSMYFLFTRQK